MNADEFEAAWETLLAKLSPDEREMVESVVSGAEVNHSLAYVLVAFAIGALFGWALAGWWPS